jgi:hypothetical protein
MPDPSTVLDLIDRAVAHWQTGPDAMRWTPDPPAAPEPASPGEHRLDMALRLRRPICDWLHAHGIPPGLVPLDAEVRITRHRGIVLPIYVCARGGGILADRAGDRALRRTLCVPLRVDPPPELSQWLTWPRRPLPRHQPPPLPVDGHAYRRRTRNRRRRHA